MEVVADGEVGLLGLGRRDVTDGREQTAVASGGGQLCHPQDAAHPQPARQAAALARAPDPDQRLLAEPGGTPLRPHHRAPDQARYLSRNVAALRADIRAFIDHHNARPKPFRWTKSADHILASIERFCRYDTPLQP